MKIRVRYINPWHFSLLFTFVYSFFVFYMYATLHPRGTPWNLFSYVFSVGAGLVAFLSVFAGYHLIKKWRNAFAGYFYFLLLLISLLLFPIFYNIYWAGLVRTLIFNNPPRIKDMLAEVKLAIGILQVPVTIATILGMYNEKILRLNQDILLKEKMLSEARLTQLQQQVDPHFLFNNLNILSALIKQSPGQAETYTQRLSQLYRYYLRSSSQSLSSLKEELQFMQDYLYLLEARFGKAFNFIINKTGHVPEEETFLVGGTLQLLMENVVKHNAATVLHPMVVSINIDADKLVMENIIHKRQAESEGVGLSNLEKRYQILAGKPITYSNDGTIFRVVIPMVKQLNYSA